MIIPKPLLPGSTVAMIGISGAIREENVQQAVENSKFKLEELGYKVIVSDTCSAKHGFLSGTDAERAAAFQDAFTDDSIDGVWCIRGGYGCIRLMDMIDWNAVQANPKPFIGYSDITTMHNMLGRMGICSFHGPMPKSDSFNNRSRESLINAITSHPDQKLINIDGSPLTCLREGVAEGELVGGNLSLIAASVGTPYAIDPRGKLIFIEEVSEYSYSIDRYLHQLYHAGYFKECSGIIFGGFTNCTGEHEGYTFTTEEILKNMASKVGVPVISGLQAGHLTETLTLPFGRAYRMDAAAGTITIL